MTSFASASPTSTVAANAPVVQRVIERIVERALPTYTIAQGGITEAILNDRLNQLDNKLSSQIFSLSASLTSLPNSLPASGGVTNTIALSQRIDNLSGTTITNPTITGGSITASSIAGTISNVLSTALAAIDDLTSNNITATNATFTNSTTTNATTTNLYSSSLVAGNATTTNFSVTGTATSSFTGGLSAARINATATSTLAGLRLTTNDCSSYGNGGTLTTDASGNVVCAADDGGAGGTVAGADTQIQFNNGGSFGAAANFTFSSSTGKLAVPYASSTALSAGTLCISTDCRTSWPTGGGGSDPFTHETWWGQSGVSATTSALHLTGSPFSLFASSTAVFELASSTAASTTRLTTGTQWFTGLTNSGLGVDPNGKVYAAATSTLSTISGTLALTQLANQNANTVLVNNTSALGNVTSIATSSFFGTGIGGTVLSWNNGLPQWVATTTFSTGLTYASGAVTCDTASGSVLGCLSSADWNTFNNKQAAGNYITALTGDVTASGPGSASVSFALGNTHWWTARQNFGNASTSQFTATSSVWFTSLGTPAGTFLAVDPNGLVIATTTPAVGGSGTVTNIATTYPITGGPITTTGTLSLAFGTTTTNTWTHQIFSSLFALSASTTNATTTNLHITGLTNSGLGVDANGKVYAAATSTLANIGGVLALTSLANQNANTVLANATGGSAAPTAIATSSFFGTGIGGTVLSWSGGVPSWVATTTLTNGAGITTTYSATNNQWTITNTGALFGYPFTIAEKFATSTSATTTSISTQGVFFASSTAAASQFPFASSTALSATTLCLSIDCRTTWPTSGGSGDPFPTHTSYAGQTTSATTSTLWLTGSTISLAASSSVLTYASSTALTISGTASTSLFFANGLSTCTSNNVLTWTNGTFGCEADDTAVGTANPFTWEDNYAATNAATTSILWAKSGVNASSTSHFANASTSLFTNSGTTWLASLFNSGLGVDANGKVYAAATTTFSTGLTYAGGTVTCDTANGSVLGCLSTTDWNTFNNKQAALAFTYPLQNAANTISLALGTTTANTWGAHNIFSSLFSTNASTTNATTTNLYITGLSNSGLGVDANGKVYAAATSTLSTISGSLNLGTQVTGSLALSSIASIAANTVLANGTGGSAAPTAIATSSFFGTGIGGTVLSWNNGVPAWVATTTLTNGAGITTTYSATNNQWTVTNTGATFAFPFTTLATYGTTTAATSSSIQTAGVFFASSTAAASVFPYASSTALSAGTLCLSTDCRTAWPTSGGSDPFTHLTINGATASATTSPFAVFNAAYFGGTATSTFTSAGFLGIGTTTPWGLLAVEQGTETNSFVVSNSGSTTPSFVVRGVNGNGFVGIGTTSPDSRLYIYDTTNMPSPPVIGSAVPFKVTDGTIGILMDANQIESVGDALYINHRATGGTGSDTWIGGGGGDIILVNGGGNVGIGTTNPDQGKVEVKGGSVCVDTNNDDNATSCIASESDERLKTNIQAISASSSLDTILALNPVSFDWRATDPEVLKHYPLLGRFASSTHSIGLVAQQVAPFVPEAIEQETVGDAQVQYLQLDYTKFIPHLIGAIKEIANLGEAFEARIIAWFASAANGITDFFADNLHARQRLCVGSTCITETQLAAVLSATSQTPAPPPAQSYAAPSPLSPSTEPTPADAATSTAATSSPPPSEPSDAATTSPDVHTEPVERVTASAPPAAEPIVDDSPPLAPEEEPEPTPTTTITPDDPATEPAASQ